MAITFGLLSDTLRQDPITGRQLSRRCWNTLHQRPKEDDANEECQKSNCDCLCHDQPTSKH
jgi:hypothetical protein